MLQLRIKQTLALALCVALIRPTPMMSAPASAVLGSVTPRGEVNVGDVRLPGMSALFAGDHVRTSAGSAMIQYQDGPRVVLGIESQASFSPSRVELRSGQMSFSTEAGGPLFTAATLRIEPTEAKSAANVTYIDHKATVSVTEGSFRVVDPSGVQLASLRTGEARLFEEAAAAVPAPPAAPPAVPPAPQIGGGNSNRAWLLALGVGIVGSSLGIAALLRASDADDRADDAASAAAAAQAQAASLSAEVNALQSQIASLATVSPEQIASLASAVSRLSAIQTQLAQAQRELAAIVAAIGAQGGVATPAQLAQLTALRTRLGALAQEAQNAQRDLNEIVEDVGGTPVDSLV